MLFVLISPIPTTFFQFTGTLLSKSSLALALLSSTYGAYTQSLETSKSLSGIIISLYLFASVLFVRYLESGTPTTDLSLSVDFASLPFLTLTFWLATATYA